MKERSGGDIAVLGSVKLGWSYKKPHFENDPQTNQEVI